MLESSALARDFPVASKFGMKHLTFSPSRCVSPRDRGLGESPSDAGPVR
jgi:hypothetical protein